MLDDDDIGHARTAPRAALMDPDDQALLGTKLGEYRVDSVLGTGGMGIVFKGLQPLIKKDVAIKVLKRSLAAEQRFGSRMLDEARAANAVHHPGIVNAFGFGQAPDGRPYLVMEFLHGVPLDARLAERGRLSQVETLELLEAILAPLEAAHAAGVIHRDLKPGNVFLQKLADGKDFPRILDFGLARHVDSTGRGSGIVGTPSYMAPEQAKEGDLTPAADLYALGCMAYEMLSGALPFEAPTAFGVIEKHLTRTPAPLDSLVMNLDDDVVALVQALMQKDPAKRPTARQARRDVARLLRALARAATVGDARPAPVGFERVAARPGAPSEAATELGIAGVDVPLPPPRRAQPPSNFSSRPTVRDAPALSHEDESARRSPWSRWVVGGLLAAMGLAALAKWVA